MFSRTETGIKLISRTGTEREKKYYIATTRTGTKLTHLEGIIT
jgi:hypothetical protein